MEEVENHLSGDHISLHGEVKRERWKVWLISFWEWRAVVPGEHECCSVTKILEGYFLYRDLLFMLENCIK